MVAQRAPAIASGGSALVLKLPDDDDDDDGGATLSSLSQFSLPPYSTLSFYLALEKDIIATRRVARRI